RFNGLDGHIWRGVAGDLLRRAPACGRTRLEAARLCPRRRRRAAIAARSGPAGGRQSGHARGQRTVGRARRGLERCAELFVKVCTFCRLSPFGLHAILRLGQKWTCGTDCDRRKTGGDGMEPEMMEALSRLAPDLWQQIGTRSL